MGSTGMDWYWCRDEPNAGTRRESRRCCGARLWETSSSGRGWNRHSYEWRMVIGLQCKPIIVFSIRHFIKKNIQKSVVVLKNKDQFGSFLTRRWPLFHQVARSCHVCLPWVHRAIDGSPMDCPKSHGERSDILNTRFNRKKGKKLLLSPHSLYQFLSFKTRNNWNAFSPQYGARDVVFMKNFLP